MKYTTRSRLIGLVLLLAARAVLGNFTDVPGYQPTWRGMAGSTLEKWSFTATPTNGTTDAYYGPEVTLPSVVSNPNGTPNAAIVAEGTGVGWVYGDSGSSAQFSSTNFGWWDLGANGGGSITLTIPTAGGPSGSIRYIWLQVMEAINPGLYELATIAVSGGTEIGSVQIT